MAEKIFQRILGRELDQEGPIGAGQTVGMPIEEVVEKYFSKRNDVLHLLRVYSNKTFADLARELEVSESDLERVANSSERVPFQWIPRLAKVLNLDLKALLIIFGHTRRSDSKSPEGEKRIEELPLAAQYSGPDLTEQEKVDLRELIRIILDSVNGTRKDA